MSMEMVAWHSMYQAAHAHEETRPFSRANALLQQQGAAPIDWRVERSA